MCLLFCISFIVFKQKTAFGRRISDWSSDVCSSDLVEAGGGVVTAGDAAFDIGFEENGALSVTVLRGEADIRFGGAPETGNPRAQVLPSGRSVTYGPGGKEQLPAASPTQQGSREWP